MIEKSLKLALIYSIVAIATFLFFSLAFGGTFSAVDVKMYYQYAEGITHGHIPYINTNIEYPPASFAYMLLAYVLSAGNPVFYLPVHMILMLSCFIGALIVAYFISLKMYNDPRRAFITGLICAASPAMAYFTLLRYDAFPTLILMISIFFFINDRDTPAYIAAAIGTLVKFFPIVVVPFYLIHRIKFETIYSDTSYFYRQNKKALLWFIAIISLGTVPFALINFNHFIYPYVHNFSRTAQGESIFFLLNILTGTTFFADIGSYILVAALIIIIYSYYSMRKKYTCNVCGHMFCSKYDIVGYITLAVCMTVIFNRVASPQYLMWATPLLAIYLSKNIKTIACFIALQIFTYIQYPILVDRLFDPTQYLVHDAAIVFFAIKYTLWAIVLIVLWKEISS